MTMAIGQLSADAVPIQVAATTDAPDDFLVGGNPLAVAPGDAIVYLAACIDEPYVQFATWI